MERPQYISAGAPRLLQLLAVNLSLQPDSPKQGGKARVVVEVGPSWFHSKKREEHVPRFERFFEPVERLVVLTQAEMDERKVRGRHICLRGPHLQLLENRAGFVAVAADCERMAGHGPHYEGSA